MTWEPYGSPSLEPLQILVLSYIALLFGDQGLPQTSSCYQPPPKKREREKTREERKPI